MKTSLIVVAIGMTLLGGCGRKASETAERQADQQTAPADTHEMMVGKVEPAAKVYWNAVQYISDKDGLHEIMPRTDAEWNRTREAAEQVRHYAELLKSPAFAEGRGQDWLDFAQGLSDVAGEAARAAEARSVDRVLETGGTLYNVCSACHEVYLPLAGGQPPAAAENMSGS